MKQLPKYIQDILKNVTVDDMVDGYIFHHTKYVKDETVRNKLRPLIFWFEKNCNAKHLMSPVVTIHGFKKQIRFTLRLQGEYKTYLSMLNRG